MSDLPEGGYPTLVREIKERIRSAQYAALKAVNKELIGLYWDIGRMIVERQAEGAWGKSVVETLASDIQAEFPGIAGFSARNIWRMRDFYRTYRDNQKLSPMVAEIEWSHNSVILEKCGDDLEREFYLRMTRAHGWTKNVLIHQIESNAYARTLLAQTNFDRTLSEERQGQAKLGVKDEYTFDFLELADEYSERQLQRGLLANVEDFLREMGGLFTLIGSEYRLEVGENEYFIDLLLFHRRLRCLVAVELKIGPFLPEYVGRCSSTLQCLTTARVCSTRTPRLGSFSARAKTRLSSSMR